MWTVYIEKETSFMRFIGILVTQVVISYLWVYFGAFFDPSFGRFYFLITSGGTYINHHSMVAGQKYKKTVDL